MWDLGDSGDRVPIPQMFSGSGSELSSRSFVSAMDIAWEIWNPIVCRRPGIFVLQLSELWQLRRDQHTQYSTGRSKQRD